MTSQPAAELGTELGEGGRESVEAADAAVEVEAADAVEDYVKEKASDKAAGAVEREARELVDTPGNVQVLTTLWIFLLQKFAFLLRVGIRWPGWFLQLIAILTIFTLDLPSVGLRVPESTWIMCVAISHILLAPSLIARSGFLVKFWRENEDAPRYGTRCEIGRAVAVGICLPSLLSAFFILIGEASREKSWTGLGVALFWPVIAYTAATHAWRVLLWRSCKAKYYPEANAAKEYWKQSYQIELLFLLFVYFSAYLTGINALLDLGWPAADDNADALLSFNNLTNATTTEQHQTMDSSVGVKVVCGICLVVYALVPPAFCAYYGKQVISPIGSVIFFGKDIVPFNVYENEYENSWRKWAGKNHSFRLSRRSRSASPGTKRSS